MVLVVAPVQMHFDRDLIACAGLVQRADPDRFMATMAAPVAARPVLFALYAMNVEVARAPWVTDEPEIAAIRLEWWRQALARIAAGGLSGHRHEVLTQLARILRPEQAAGLDDYVTARYWDIGRDPFEDDAHFARYIDQTSGTLIWVGAHCLGPADQDVVRDFAFAAGLANWFRAVPELRARGRAPLPQDDAQAIRALARGALDRLERARARRAQVSRAAAAGLLAGWQAESILCQVARDPGRVAAGTLGQGELGRRFSLMRQVVTGRW